MATWASDVNNNFYGLDAKPVENREATQYKSGRKIYHKINTAQKVNHSVFLRLDDGKKDSNNKTEFMRFLEWYEVTAGSGSVPITLTDIEVKTGTKDYYVIAGNWSGQRYKEIALTLEEC
jgi:hypothetical protein